MALSAKQHGGEDLPDFDAVVVGAGFAGMYMLHRLRDKLGLSARVYEAGGDVGGTWYWNRYPGARCDIQSYHYSYSFSEELQQEWEWSEHFAAQPEILAYLNHVADRFELRPDIQFDTRVTAATYEESGRRWVVETDDGQRVRAQFFIAAVGCLSAANIPDLAGRDSFEGETYFTGDWPHEGVDFSGRRVGVIGTGATGIQVVPNIAQEAAQLTVFQRTPAYAAPIGNGPLDAEFQRRLKANYSEVRRRELEAFAGVPFDDVRPSALAVSDEERQRVYEEKWAEGDFSFWLGSFGDILFDQEANDTAAEFVRERISERVEDPEVAEMLTPRDYPYGTKRQPLEDGYYETFNRDNVSLVDVQQTPIEEITAHGVRTADQEHPLDSIVFATGFDAFTGALFRMNIRGRDGVLLQEQWEAGPSCYMGLSPHGFPNFFIITGPQSPSVLFNMPLSIEQHAEWISDCIEYMRAHGHEAIEPDADAERRWTEHVKEVANATLMPKANSWYLGANIADKPRVFMVYLGGGAPYRQACDEVAAKGYEGFTLS